MFRATCLALFLTACATEQEAPRDAETGVQTVDLREAGSTIVDVSNGGDDVEVIRPNGQIVPLVEKQIAQYRSLYNDPRLDTVEKVIADIQRRHQTAMGKVKIVHPPTPQISLIYG